MRKYRNVVILLAVMCFLATACGTWNLSKDEMTGVEPSLTPQDAYYYALRFYNGAWESYHKVWVALPEAQKAEWVKKYHPKFKKAGDHLTLWSKSVTDPSSKEGWKKLKDDIQSLMIELSIRK